MVDSRMYTYIVNWPNMYLYCSRCAEGRSVKYRDTHGYNVCNRCALADVEAQR